METYLITGGAGFIGSHLAEYLLEQGHTVHCMDNLSTGSLDNVWHLMSHPRFRFVEGPVEDLELLAEAARGCCGIFHLAAAVGVDVVMDDPVRTMETNVQGTSAVLRFAAEHSIRVLVTSTSEVYGKSAALPFREDDDVVYGPVSKLRWSYALSKAMDEFLVRAWAQTRGLRAMSVRLFNTAGPGQSGRYGMVIPRFVEQALRGGPITVYGDGEQTRCFTHVRDVVPALARLMEVGPMDGDVVNIGSTEQVSISELARRVRDLVHPAVPIVYVPLAEAHGAGFEETRDRVPALEKVRRMIGYEARFGLDEILRDVVGRARGRLGVQAFAA